MHWDGVHDLVERAKAGDEQAWRELFVQAQPYMARLAQRALGPQWPQQSVSDLLSGTWLRVCKGIADFRGGENDIQTGALFRAWLGKTLKNVRRNDLRFDSTDKRKQPPGTVRLGTAGDGCSASGLDVAGKEPTPSTNVRAEERTTLVQEALAELSDVKDREIIRLCFFEDIPLSQVSKQMDLSYDDVRTRFHRSLKRLKPKLKRLQ
jgi:RNA polymerase sigma factor (sigma-70 family)